MTNRQKILLLGTIFLLAALSIAWWILTPRVVSYSPTNLQQDVVPSDTIEVTFNTTLSDQDYEGLVQIQPDLAYTIQLDGNRLNITPVDSLKEGTAFTVTILPGIKSTLGLLSTKAATWTFHVKNPWLLYFLDGEKKTDLYRIDPSGLTTDLLMEITEDLIDYSVSPDGSAVIYSVRSGQDTIIRSFDLLEKTHTPLHTCPNLVCSQPVLSSDGKYLAFMSGASPNQGGQGSGKVVLLTLGDQTGASEPVTASGNDHPTRDPAWSSRGWLVIYDDVSAEFLFIKPSTGETKSLPNETGEPGSWSPDGRIYLIPEITYVNPLENQGVEYFSRLIQYDPELGKKSDLTQNNQVEDLIPAFSPSGVKVAFARRFLNRTDWTPGRQVWLVDQRWKQCPKNDEQPGFQPSWFRLEPG